MSPLAGKPAPAELLIDIGKLERAYYERQPEPIDPKHADQVVSFGTSGHRGKPFDGTFTEAHILAITQAVCEYRHGRGYSGPLFIGKDTHAASDYAQRTAIEVLAANNVQIFLQRDNGFTPTPVISRAILVHNRGRGDGFADGLLLTPSHNPAEDGGIKYNPPNGGPADTDVTDWIQNRANQLLKNGNKDVKRVMFESAVKDRSTHQEDFVQPYVNDLASVLDMECIRSSGVKIGIDPLGGASVGYWEPIAARYGINLTVVNPVVDPTFRFGTVDHDGKIRMDPSSPYAMAGLVKLKDQFDIAFGTDPDVDRHSIITPSAGFLNPNQYLAVAIRYLLTHRPHWSKSSLVGKTLVSSGLIDRVVTDLGRKLCEVPVGFKWFVEGLFDGSLCFAGEESAGACFLRKDGTTWITDKDAPIMGLLAAEITARSGKDPGKHYAEITSKHGQPFYARIDSQATPSQKKKLKQLTPEAITETMLAGEPIVAKLTRAEGNNAPIGGLKVTTKNGWFAARPSGTENLYKLYAESFRSEAHLRSLVREAQEVVARALRA
jgi:phosphoglucomutase